MNPEIQPKVISTADGSSTLYLADKDETYHSRHGAIQESDWVFIRNGLNEISDKNPTTNILEIGFGTGLNTWLSWNNSETNHYKMNYCALETYPLDSAIWKQLHFDLPEKDRFSLLHESAWEQPQQLSEYFNLRKMNCPVQDFESAPSKFNLIYFDAFGPRVQPEMWERNILEKMFTLLQPGGVLVTYCAKGQVRRDLQDVGFMVERLPGPPGKREMLRATKAEQ